MQELWDQEEEKHMSLSRALVATMLMALAIWSSAAEKTLPTLDMSADGEVHIALDGQVTNYALKSELTPTIASLVDRNVRSWRFEPIVVDGQPVAAKTALHIDIQATPIAGKDSYALRITNVRFGEPRRSAKMKAPRYPQEAVRVGLGAKVLLNLRLDDAGNVVEVEPYQTNLNARPNSEFEAKHWREVFEKVSVSAAKTWHFDLSETIDGKAFGTTAIIPIVYSVVGGPIQRAKPGQWQPYLPGPVHPAPWLKAETVANADAVASLKDGQALSLDSRFRLKDAVIGHTL
jgi:hypothetical protein